MDLLAVGIDVPYPLYPCWEVFFLDFGEFNILFSESWESAGQVGVFGFMVTDAEAVVESFSDGDLDSTGFGRVGYGILSYNDFAIGKTGAYVVAEVAVDGWNHADKVIGYATDAAE